MARKPMEFPTGVEIRNGAIRIRFIFQGKRCSETLPYPDTPTGIASAARLRDQVIQLNKLGLLDEAKYSELFPNSNLVTSSLVLFGDYAQSWLNTREVVEQTKAGYRSNLNTWWMGKLALVPVKAFSPALMRKVIGDLDWHSDAIKRASIKRLSTILRAAVKDGLLDNDPLDNIELPKAKEKKPDPFSQEEANTIIKALYSKSELLQIKGALFEFAFFTGLRLGEVIALKWEDIDPLLRKVHVRRTITTEGVKDRTKTKKERFVLLNQKAKHALEFAKKDSEQRYEGKEASAYCFPSRKGHHFTGTNALHEGWPELLQSLGVRYRKPYNTRHTYATLCLMSGMNPAFIANQLGHSVEVLLSTYADWLNSDDDWKQLDKLNIAPNLPQDT